MTRPYGGSRAWTCEKEAGTKPRAFTPRHVGPLMESSVVPLGAEMIQRKVIHITIFRSTFQFQVGRTRGPAVISSATPTPLNAVHRRDTDHCLKNVSVGFIKPFVLRSEVRSRVSMEYRVTASEERVNSETKTS